MSGPLHSKQTIADGIHSPISVTYATSASMAAASGFTADDLYKMALVLDTKSLWLLTTTSPANWTLMTTTNTDVSASFITVGVTGSLPNERALAAGVGISLFDDGPGGNLTVVAGQTPQFLTGSGAASVAHDTTLLQANGVGNSITLADGTRPGQMKSIIGDSGYGANTSIISPTNPLGFTTVTLDATGDTVHLKWTGAKWAIIGGNGHVVA